VASIEFTTALISAASPVALELNPAKDPDSAINLIEPNVSPTSGELINPRNSNFSKIVFCSF
jgi:hypothetical protein